MLREVQISFLFAFTDGMHLGVVHDQLLHVVLFHSLLLFDYFQVFDVFWSFSQDETVLADFAMLVENEERGMFHSIDYAQPAALLFYVLHRV